MNSLQLDLPKMTWGSGGMRGPPGTPHPPAPGPATDRQGLAGVLACHVLHSHSEVSHGALAAAEVEAVRVHIEQVPVGTGVGWERRGGREAAEAEAVQVHIEQVPVGMGAGGRAGAVDGQKKLSLGHRTVATRLGH